MPGELGPDGVLIADEKEASQIYNKGYYGTPQTGGALSLSLLEAAYLCENERLQVLSRGKEVSLEALIRQAQKKSRDFEIKFIVYRDLRSRGYVIKMADNVDFRVYPRGCAPSRTPSKYWVLALSERAVFDLDTLSETLARVNDVRKELLLGVVDEESDITYYGVRRLRPMGVMRQSQLPEKVEGLLLDDRVMVFDTAAAESLHKAEFYGRLVNAKYLQLSLIETAHLMEKGILALSNKAGKPVALGQFLDWSRKRQKDFDLRIKIYRDLKSRGILAKTGFKYGAHFRGYERDPSLDHARYLVHAVPRGFVSTWPEVSRAVRLAHGVKKDIMFGRLGPDGGRQGGKDGAGDPVEYISLHRMRP